MNIHQMFIIANHGFIYFDDNTLYAFGVNMSGQLGIGYVNDDEYHDPKFVMKDPDIIKILCCPGASLLYKIDGSILICGTIKGLINKIDKFQLLMKKVDVVDIVLCEDFVAILMENNDIIIYGIKTYTFNFGEVLRIYSNNNNNNDTLYIYTKKHEIMLLKISQLDEPKMEFYKIIPDVIELFVFNDEIFVAKNNRIEKHTINDFNIIYQSDDLYQIYITNKKIIISHNNGDIFQYYRFKSDILSLDALINNLPNEEKKYTFDYVNKIGKDDRLYADILLTEIVQNDEIFQLIDLIEEKNHDLDPLKINDTFSMFGSLYENLISNFSYSRLTIDKFAKNMEYYKCKNYYDWIYETPIKLFGSGTIIYKFDPNTFQSLPNYIKRKIHFLSLHFIRYKVEQNTCLPRFIRYLIFDWLVKIG